LPCLFTSLEKPKENNQKGCYVILTINADSSNKNKDAGQLEFIRFDDDVQKAAKALEEGSLPNEYADKLRNGFKKCM